MEYTRVSIKEVIARIVRNLGGGLPSEYLDSLLEWIPESMEELQTTHELITSSTPDKDCEGALVSQDHVAWLPKGLVYIRAVEDEYGRRIRRGTDETDITHQSTRQHTGADGPFNARSTNFQADVDQITGGITEEVTDTSVPWDGSNIVNVDSTFLRAYYKVQGGCIQTSVESMFIKIHYDCLPTDSEGYPTVIDLHEYKEAIYWYVLSKLIGAGFKHPLFQGLQGLDYIYAKYEEYSSLALGKIKLPDVDRAARLADSFSQRLIPPYHFYEDFSIGGEQKQGIGLI